MEWIIPTILFVIVIILSIFAEMSSTDGSEVFGVLFIVSLALFLGVTIYVDSHFTPVYTETINEVQLYPLSINGEIQDSYYKISENMKVTVNFGENQNIINNVTKISIGEEENKVVYKHYEFDDTEFPQCLFITSGKSSETIVYLTH